MPPQNLRLIEDNAQACGGSYKDRALGTLGDMGCFSFQFHKIITAGEGGAVVTADPFLFDRARSYHDTAACWRPDRTGAHAFILGDGTPRVAVGHNAIFWVDSGTGRTRPSTVADVEQFTPTIAVRGARALWESSGGRDAYQLAREAAAPYRDGASRHPLNGREFAARQIIQAFERGFVPGPNAGAFA